MNNQKLAKNENQENKALCILPWIHAQLRQNGEVFPCCRAQDWYSYGSTLTKTLDEVWNSEEIKKVRKEMLAGTAQSFCGDCYTTEKLGSQSYRQDMNKNYKDEFLRLEQTDPDGHLHNKDIIFFDIRFSNICNFKCRSCSPESSNSWYEDFKSIHQDWNEKKRVFKLSEGAFTLADIERRLPQIQRIYFAGGEPLLDENHYKVLEKLIEIGRADIQISYNTNLSLLNYKNWSALKLWQKLKHVEIGASIDAIGPALGLIRKGANWEDIKNNLALIRLFNPKVSVRIYPTVSIMNCFLLPQLIGEFIESSYIKSSEHLKLNILNDPDYLNVSILTLDEIERMETEYNIFIKSIEDKVNAGLLKYIETELMGVVAYARHQNLTHLRPAFRKYTFMLDKLRNEKTVQVIPELFSVLYQDQQKAHVDSKSI
ncbi:MAG: twitch domain-containing radical SAM protein [Bdellovibrionota bacterium]